MRPRVESLIQYTERNRPLKARAPRMRHMPAARLATRKTMESPKSSSASVMADRRLCGSSPRARVARKYATTDVRTTTPRTIRETTAEPPQRAPIKR